MAEAFTRHYAGDAIDVASAGTMPSDRIHPVVAQVMLEQGIDLSASRPKLLTAEIADRADRLITMGCSIEEICPVKTPSKAWAGPRSGASVDRERSRTA